MQRKTEPQLNRGKSFAGSNKLEQKKAAELIFRGTELFHSDTNQRWVAEPAAGAVG